MVFLPVSAYSEVVDRIVAVVNDSVITLSELNASAALASESFKLSGSDGPDGKVEMKSSVLDALIERKLVLQASERMGINIGEHEIDEAVEDVRAKNGLSHERLLIALADSGLTYKEYREQLRGQLREVKFMTIKFRSKVILGTEDLKEYYTQYSDKFPRDPAVRIRLMFFSNESGELKAKRLKVVKEGLARGEEFAALAKKYSEGPGAQDGGDIGFVAYSELDITLRQVMDGLKEGGVSREIVSSKGTSLFQLVSRRAAGAMPFIEVEKQIRQIVFQERVEQRFEFWLEAVKKVAHIEVTL
jgi:peptidyl-prolyl cis-trans isomerase SurA